MDKAAGRPWIQTQTLNERVNGNEQTIDKQSVDLDPSLERVWALVESDTWLV